MPLPLETERLLIRPFSQAHLVPLHLTVRSDPEVMRFIPRPLDKNRDETTVALKRWIDGYEKNGLAPLAVEHKGSGEFLGICGVFPLGMEGPEMEIAWILGRRHWGKGYATEAARACLRHGFEEHRLNRIVAIIFPDNTASIHVAEKVGMVYEGLGQFYDHEMLCYAAPKPVLLVRRYRDQDCDAIWSLHNRALEAVGAHLGNGPWDEDLLRIPEAYFAGGDFLVGELSGEIVAMGAIRRQTTDCAEVKRMRVAPRFQRRGFGQQILDLLQQRAVELGYSRLCLDTTVQQVAAQRLYQKNGFTEVGRRVGPFESILYEKALRHNAG